jgi:hypothetical protein
MKIIINESDSQKIGMQDKQNWLGPIGGRVPFSSNPRPFLLRLLPLLLVMLLLLLVMLLLLLVIILTGIVALVTSLVVHRFVIVFTGL